ncbi:FG-GAP repeat protein [Streptomyces sp. YIM 121038]|uniref:FG-GAP-like repeat-containing protein n=1 Tax=Streptomyces sp. YIM 121038 TaxID=2136401 RepID=UPI001110ED8C|nr:FG-GAP-like repeat-containing protein [Streptomyces sp. YIM 121038]QCX78063.1 FG-GAP repeat protein [Streptomyces sp. YIM 121038]
MRLRTAALLTTTLTAATLTPLALPATATAAPAKHADDFNGDGYRDYATPQSGEGNKGGSVHVTFGTANGPGTRTQVVDQDSPGVPGADERGDSWAEGTRVAADFDRDGYGDLAVSAVGEKVGRNRGQGSVTVLWGSPTGLKGGTEIPNKAPGARKAFGYGLATGDFNGDGRPDLAATNGGAVYVYKGGISRSGVGGSVQRLAKRGLSPDDLIAGRVTKDRATDLVVVGQVIRDWKETGDAWFVKGGTTLKPGATLRLGAYADSTSGVIADFDKNGYGDLALGNYADAKYKGAVAVWRGGRNGPGTATRLTQGTPGVAGAPEKGDRFGGSVSAGDTNGDGYPDLAVGASSEDVGGTRDGGGVHVLRGGAGGLKGAGSKWFARDSAGIPGAPSEGDRFGSTVRLRDTDLDGYADLYAHGEVDPVRLPGSPSGIKNSGVTRVEYGIVEGFLQ